LGFLDSQFITLLVSKIIAEMLDSGNA